MEQTGQPLEKFIQVFAKSQPIFKEDSLGNEMYIVYSGKVELYKGQGKQSVLLATPGAGEFFGEMALIDGSPRSATAIAAEDDTRLVALDEAKFLFLLRHQPEFALIVMQQLCHRLRQTTERETTRSKA